MNRFLKNSYLILIYLFLYLPIFILILYSFNNAQYSMQWKGATLDWYNNLFDDTDLWIASMHSLWLATLSSFIATFIGTIASISFYHYRFAGRKVLYALLFILIIMPDIVFACALLLFFHISKLPLGFYSLLIAHISFSIPFVMLTLQSRIKQLDKNLFHAATDLGAEDLVIVTRIIIPLLSSAILSAFLLSFTLSFDDVLISYFVAGPGFEILPLKIYSLIRSGIKPEINALCSIVFFISFLLVILSQQLLKKR